MPTYVYACNECGKQFEQFQSFKDAPLQHCPCGRQGAVRRVIQPVGIVFKGSGWYINDSRGANSSTVSDTGSKSEPSKSEPGKNEADKSEPSKSEKSETATSTKPDTSDTPAT